ncbi:MAG: histidine--tRNA ligase, partial [Clostridiales bacterium]|nr:histidine--tRNA ligase [Clostridiales bacterium]
LLPDIQVQFDTMVERIRESFSLYGFTALDTPVIEASEILLVKAGGETEKQIYRFTKGEHDLALRFDLTVPLAKYVAKNYGQLAFPFRRYQIGKVYRGERAQRGRFREFYQCDIDIVGDGSLNIMNDAEIPGIIYHTFTSLGLEKFTIRFNNRKVLNGFYSILGLSDTAAGIMRCVDKLDKIGPEKVRELLIDECSVPGPKAGEILALIMAGGDPFEALSAYSGKNEMFDEGVSELREVSRHMAAFGVPAERCTVDLKISRGLDYYTGTVYETFIEEHPEIGSICSGGRYDDLAGYYTNKRLPDVGISIGLTRLFYVLDEQGYLNDEALTAPADVLIIPMTDDISHAISTATAMRARGIRALLFCENRKFKAKIGYADKLGIPFVAFLGEDEISQGKITVKDMKTGEQVMSSLPMLLEGICEKLRVMRSPAPIKQPENTQI